MIIKVVQPDAYDFSEPVYQLVKVSSRGLLGEDRRVFEKRASIDFMSKLASLQLHPDETLVHALIIGATEDFGPNRNGDGFRRQTCRDYHNTFVKHARIYREHKNKDPSKSYGIIKASAFNEAMRRIELLLAFNATKEAAARNGGLLADRELEKLANGRDLGLSMACRVGHDICSWCKNKATTRDDYCTGIEEGGLCKAGGLKHNIGRLVDVDGDLHHLHADNPFPTFFDCSHVWRPADRIAFVLGQLEKAASATGRAVSGAELAAALGVTIPFSLVAEPGMPSNVQHMLKLAYTLSEVEQAIEAGGCREVWAMPAFSREATSSLTTPPKFYREKFASTLRALADAHVCLAPEQFIALTTDHPWEACEKVAVVIRHELPGIYTRLLASGDFSEKIARNPYVPAPSANDTFRLWAEKQAATYSLRPQSVQQQVWRAALTLDPVKLVCARRGFTKSASATSDSAYRLAEQYALYKLGFLAALPEDENLMLTANLAAVQNYSI